MKAGRIIGRVVSTRKYKSLEGRKILLLKPMEWSEVAAVFSGKKKYSEKCSRSVIALDAVGAGSSEYVFYVSSKATAYCLPLLPIMCSSGMPVSLAMAWFQAITRP